MNTRCLGRAVVATLILAAGGSAAAAGQYAWRDRGEEHDRGHGGSSPSGETIVRWNENNFALLTTLDNGAPAGLELNRALTIVHIAMHDAANGVRSKYERYALTETDAEADPALAAAAAAHAALVTLRPGKAAEADAFLQTDLDRVTDPDKRRRSLDLGAAAADAILARRADDGFFDVVPYTFDAPAPGVYQPVPPANTEVIGTQLPFVTPFALASTDQFRPPPPPSLFSHAWKFEYDEVKELGRSTSTVRTEDQTQAVLFWLEQTQFVWNRIARIAATERDKGLWQTARAFALVNMGLMDGLLSNFEAKYHYNYWRPFTAIREVDDGRDDTVMDPAWEPLTATPGHPEYNSAQGVSAGAAASVLSRIYGIQFAFTLTTTTADPAASTRSYDTFIEAVIEGALSRIWGGIHFRSSTLLGGIQGLLIGSFIYDYELRPTDPWSARGRATAAVRGGPGHGARAARQPPS
ncbi:MAG: vanadium-dependent haloperoxidase [Vicinamibacteraceae bacterium]